MQAHGLLRLVLSGLFLASALACDPAGPAESEADTAPDVDAGDAGEVQQDADVAAPAPLACPSSCPDDGKPCTDDLCNPGTGFCGVPLPDGAPCDPGACAVASCAAGVCLPEVTGCDDGDPCTVDACDRELGCLTNTRGALVRLAGEELPLETESPHHIVVASSGVVYQ